MLQNAISSREAAYLSCLTYEKEGRYIEDFLKEWSEKSNPTSQDFRLAQEISYGTCRMQLTLETYAKQLTNKKLTLKRKERILLFTALYQYYFLDRIPIYAITDQTIEIAKKYCHSYFIRFLNALLRKLPTTAATLPTDNSLKSLSARYSYPQYYIEALCNEHSLDQVLAILDAGNSSTILMARKIGHSLPYPQMVSISSEELPQLIHSKDIYIQNSTPALLIKALSENSSTPKSILDLCASPGGKLISCRDLFPEAQLYANDISANKITILQENLQKYAIKANISCGLGEQYHSDRHYDLIILDVPCSNTGVLNKRPEARWRLSKEHTRKLNTQQERLLQHAKELLINTGEIWYMTCSILAEENELFTSKMAEKFNLRIRKEIKILPDLEGKDGGYACAFSTSNHI